MSAKHEAGGDAAIPSGMKSPLVKTAHASFFNIDTSRSYATEEKLLKGLQLYGFHEDRYLVVCNRQGRFTAIFPQSNIRDGNMLRYASRGFMTLG